MAKRCSKNPEADEALLGESIYELYHVPRCAMPLDEVAKLGGRVQKLARRLRDRERYVEFYGEAPS